MVFQKKANPFPMSVYDNVAFGPRTHGIKGKAELDEIVETALRKAAIFDEVKRPPGRKKALSRFRADSNSVCVLPARSRLSLKCCLWTRRQSALDPISAGRIEELAIELKRDYTVVMVTHNMQQAARVSDKCAFFLLGDLVEFDDTKPFSIAPNDKRKIIAREGSGQAMARTVLDSQLQLDAQLLVMASSTEDALHEHPAALPPAMPKQRMR